MKVCPETVHAGAWKRPKGVVRDLEAFMKDIPRPRPL
jgi:hypothetical protein